METAAVDRIAIHDIRARGCYGWTSEERATPQPLTIDVDLELDVQRAAHSDDLADTVDYAALHRRIVEIVESASHALLEKLGAVLLDAIFEDRRIAGATLRITKPGFLDGASPSVTLHRENPRTNV
jgi:FolB domain-containing protein